MRLPFYSASAALCLLTASLLPGCIHPVEDEPRPAEPPLLDTRWQLTILGTTPVSEMPNFFAKPDFQLSTGTGRLMAHAYCNGIGGAFTTAAENKLSFDQLTVTLATCEDDATGFENNYFMALRATRRFLVLDSTLRLFDDTNPEPVAYFRVAR
ncbi:META domain-containing protein [Hymenobacter guriensis]|uniref:META domain-containing protein n=1 Tax=Hymenobacter guriensis TaxID=2793065 RepID=A0ABS0L503_9BACT|nr:META domain-containing protein [Hymenobacter guriensis]MBG8555211.1 META domain-containing protein [Hymenobacter guriensis]